MQLINAAFYIFIIPLLASSFLYYLGVEPIVNIVITLILMNLVLLNRLAIAMTFIVDRHTKDFGELFEKMGKVERHLFIEEHKKTLF